MAYTYPSDSQVLAEASLNNLYTNEKRRAYSKESLALEPWHTDRGRSSSDGHVQISPTADHCIPKSADSPTSATSLRSKDQTPRRLVSGLTCYFWAIKGHCKHSSEECLYAHEITGKLAQAPVQVEEGSEFSFSHFTYRHGASVRADYINCNRTRSCRQKRVEPSPCLRQLERGAFTISRPEPKVRSSATGRLHQSQSSSE